MGKQLQVEYEIDIDQMIYLYEQHYPNDVEIDQVQWKTFWMKNQHYHTICLACITNRKEKQREENMKAAGIGGGGVGGPGSGGPRSREDEREDYPDWGPVFLSAASKAILLNWLRKAQRSRAAKKARKQPRVMKSISDDEGDDGAPDWMKQKVSLTPT